MAVIERWDERIRACVIYLNDIISYPLVNTNSVISLVKHMLNKIRIHDFQEIQNTKPWIYPVFRGSYTDSMMLTIQWTDQCVHALLGCSERVYRVYISVYAMTVTRAYTHRLIRARSVAHNWQRVWHDYDLVVFMRLQGFYNWVVCFDCKFTNKITEFMYTLKDKFVTPCLFLRNTGNI